MGCNNLTTQWASGCFCGSSVGPIYGFTPLMDVKDESTLKGSFLYGKGDILVRTAIICIEVVVRFTLYFRNCGATRGSWSSACEGVVRICVFFQSPSWTSSVPKKVSLKPLCFRMQAIGFGTLDVQVACFDGIRARAQQQSSSDADVLRHKTRKKLVPDLETSVPKTDVCFNRFQLLVQVDKLRSPT